MANQPKDYERGIAKAMAALVLCGCSTGIKLCVAGLMRWITHGEEGDEFFDRDVILPLDQNLSECFSDDLFSHRPGSP